MLAHTAGVGLLVFTGVLTGVLTEGNCVRTQSGQLGLETLDVGG